MIPLDSFVFCGFIYVISLLIAYGLALLLIKLPVKTILRQRIAEPVDAWLITEKKRDGREGLSVLLGIPQSLCPRL